MSKAYLLDTSATFAFTDDEPGADTVAELLDKATKEQISVQREAKRRRTIFSSL